MNGSIQPSMTDDRLDRLVRQLLDERADEVAAASITAEAMAERIAMRVRRSPFTRSWMLLAAAALLVALATGAIVVGASLMRPPSILPALVVSPSPAVSPTSATPFPTVSPAPSALASNGPAPWIVFRVNGQPSGPQEPTIDPPLWAMRADGSGAHAIAGFGPVAWSRDGTRLLSLNDGGVSVAEVAEDIGPFVDIGVEVPTNEQWEAFDFAPDSERVVFMRKSKCAAASAQPDPRRPGWCWRGSSPRRREPTARS